MGTQRDRHQLHAEALQYHCKASTALGSRDLKSIQCFINTCLRKIHKSPPGQKKTTTKLYEK
ncbi:hypothetical protein DPMN_169279 [Dreissena polymorpha]|uniref:Uncharacterized protein n=1 Tax=Dreissena polymorpha TaxID=45954 RepID=A0A9D4F4Y6_DREPO|nr:hypothetical protein DPMN_169279 [Dreissena polymorpha]